MIGATKLVCAVLDVLGITALKYCVRSGLVSVNCGLRFSQTVDAIVSNANRDTGVLLFTRSSLERTTISNDTEARQKVDIIRVNICKK